MMMEDFSKYNGEGTDLRRAQIRMLTILQTVDKICREYDIPYWLSGGTALGAVRHQGFIPWDDDIDIEIMYSDYKKLLPILERELPKDLVLQNYKKDPHYPYIFAKVRETHSIVEEKGIEGTFKIKEKGIYIDIFPVERMHMSVKKKIDFLYGRSFRRIHHFEALNTPSAFLSYIFSWMIYPLCLLSIKIVRSFYKFIPTNHISCTFGIPFYTHRNYEDIFPVKEIEFEHKKFLCCHHIDSYLNKLYGNYMQIPPAEKRFIHFSKITFFD